MSGMWLVSYVALWFLVLLAVAAVVAALRQIGLLYERVAQPSVPRTKLSHGDKLPEVKFTTLAGEPVRLSQVLVGPLSLMIVSPGCSGCGSLLRQLAAGELGEDTRKHIVILSVASSQDTEELLRQTGMPSDTQVLVDAEGGIRRIWGIHATPATVHVDENLLVLEQNLGFFNSAMVGGMRAHTGSGHIHRSQVYQEEGRESS